MVSSALRRDNSASKVPSKPFWSSFLGLFDSLSVMETEDDISGGSPTLRITPMDLFNPLREVSQGVSKPDLYYTDDEDEDVSCTCSSSFHSYSTSSSQSRVSFHEQVEVFQIPSHREFSLETRLALWETPVDFQANLERNMVEFFVDGGDWRTATEESHFAPLPTGEYVHPATWMRSAPLYSPGSLRKYRNQRPPPYKKPRNYYMPRHGIHQAPQGHPAPVQYHQQYQAREDMPRYVVSTSAA